MVRFAHISREVVTDLKGEGFSADSCVLLDECSMQASWHVAHLERLFQHVTGKEEAPMGGCVFFPFGDWTQLGPVKAGKKIPQAILDIYGDNDARAWWMGNRTPAKRRAKGELQTEKRSDQMCPYYKGAALFTKVRWFELTQQQRCLDPVHTDFIESRFRGKPIDHLLVHSGYPDLTEDDMLLSEWVGACALVSTNRQRYSLTHVRANHFACYYGRVVFCWRKQVNAASWEGKPANPHHVLLAQEDPCFYEYFVMRAGGFFMCNYLRELKLVNALLFIYHSIKFDAETEKYIELVIRKVKLGDVITVEKPPLFINVELDMPENTPEDVLTARRGFSTERGKIIVPVEPLHSKWDNSPTPVRGGDGFQPKVLLKQFFPIEPSFAITVHKSEGRTINRVIIALSGSQANRCNFSYKQVHVTFSRLKQGSHIHLLRTGRTAVDKLGSLLYLNKLNPDPAIFFYFAGFRDSYEEKLENPNMNWQTNVWCPVCANAKVRFC